MSTKHPIEGLKSNRNAVVLMEINLQWGCVIYYHMTSHRGSGTGGRGHRGRDLYGGEILEVIFFCEKLTFRTCWYTWLLLDLFLVAFSTIYLILKIFCRQKFSRKFTFLLHKTGKKFNFLKTSGKQGVLAMIGLEYTIRLSISFQWSTAASRGL